jgi:5-methylcytosine-specific restriction endonuclease McrA
MPGYSLSHLSNSALRAELSQAVEHERGCTANVIARLAEYQARRLYADDGYASMHAYCVEVLRFSDDAAWRRTRAAGTARNYPVIFEMLADGRLHLTAVCLLAPYLTEQNSEELLRAAVHKGRRAIEIMLAGRFPQPDLPTRVHVVSSSAPQAPTHLANASVNGAPMTGLDLSASPFELPVANGSPPSNSAPGQPCAPAPARLHNVPARVAALAPARFGLQVTIDQQTHDLLREAQELMSQCASGNDLSLVLRRALDLLVAHLRKSKFSDSVRPRAPRAGRGANRRYIPAHVRRAVWRRDGGRCTFIGDNGHRCEARKHIEFDHVLPVAQGGEPTIPNTRLRCRTHNQLEAERALGSEFMRHARARARENKAMVGPLQEARLE